MVDTVSSSKASLGPSDLAESDRPAKRPKLCEPEDEEPLVANNGDQVGALPELAPETWANVMDFLTYDSVLSSAATAKTMLIEVMPLVSMLHIDRARQLHSGVARRYRGVVDIYIYSLLGGNVDLDPWSVTSNTVDQDTVERAVPFLANFTKLERVFVGGFETSKGLCVGFLQSFYDVEEVEKVRFLINSICGAFRSGSLSNKLCVFGLVAVARGDEEVCQTSLNLLRSFPFESIVNMGYCHSSSSGEKQTLDSIECCWMDHGLYHMDIDINSQDSRIYYMQERPGGVEFLERYYNSHEMLYNHISTVPRITIITEEGNELYVLKVEEIRLKRIEIIIKGSVDVTKLPSAEVTHAIKRAFAEDDRDPIPPREQCYLAQSTFYALKEMGFQIDELDFLNRDEYDGTRMKTNLPVDQVRDYNFHYQWRFY